MEQFVVLDTEHSNPQIQMSVKRRRLLLFLVGLTLLLDIILFRAVDPIAIKYQDLQHYNFYVNSTRPGEAYILQSGVETEMTSIDFFIASSVIFQLILSPMAGIFIDHMGAHIAVVFGQIVLIVSSGFLVFASDHGMLLAGRILHGVANAFAYTSCLTITADWYNDTRDRSTALGIILAIFFISGFASPAVIGITYNLTESLVPYIALAIIALIFSLLVVLVIQPIHTQRISMQNDNPPSRIIPIYKLIRSSLILVCSGALVTTNVSLAFLEPILAMWMKDTMFAAEWQIGVVWMPGLLSSPLGVLVTVLLLKKYPKEQWLLIIIGLCLAGNSCLMIPFCRTYSLVMIPISIITFGIAMVYSTIMPTLSNFVDTHHANVYGSVYAIAVFSESIPYIIGHMAAAKIVSSIGFVCMNVGLFLCIVLYIPLLFILYRYQRQTL